VAIDTSGFAWDGHESGGFRNLGNSRVLRRGCFSFAPRNKASTYLFALELHGHAAALPNDGISHDATDTNDAPGISLISPTKNNACPTKHFCGRCGPLRVFISLLVPKRHFPQKRGSFLDTPHPKPTVSSRNLNSFDPHMRVGTSIAL
jgi:hypothetical protein